MSNRSLLDYVQTIMEDMNSDSVNSIGDSLESQRVANILRRTYFDMASELDLPTAYEMFVLVPLADTDRPTHMLIPNSVQHIDWVKYDMRVDAADSKLNYTDVPYMDPEEFFDRQAGLNATDSNVQVVEDPTNIKIAINTDRNPAYWTSFDGKHAFFDAFDSNISSTIEASKIACHGRVTKGWTHNDSYVPDIPDHMEATFLAIAEERAFAWVKQQESRVTIDNARRYRISGRNDKDRITEGRSEYPNFGRSGSKTTTRTRLR